MILDEILDYKRRHVADVERATPLAALRERIARARAPRDFGAALSAPGMSLIAEVKPRSPSKGSFSMPEGARGLARRYVRNGARAVSVLADERYFGGSPDLVAEIAGDPEVTVPILFKEFVVSPYQVYQARATGADAILLIARGLPGSALPELIGLSRSLGLAPLVEVFTEEEVDRALRGGATLVGINNRDLQSFAVDLTISERLRPRIPAGVIAVSESGLHGRADVRRMEEAGFDGILVGETLLTAADPGQRVRVLLGHERSAGFFGPYGGRFAAETLMHPLEQLEAGYRDARQSSSFQAELDQLLRDFVGRPTPLTPLKRLTRELGGARIYAKREDLTHTGAHKINNALGQALLAQRLGKRRIIAETGAGQHGVAVATACALLDLECVVYMGCVDAARQAVNVQRMKLLGAEVRLVENGTQTLKDAISEALRDWITNVENTHYLLGSALGPDPFPTIVRDFQAVIGTEAREQILSVEKRLPDAIVACVGGGSNSIGMFSAFLDAPEVALYGVQAAGRGLKTGKHAAPLLDGQVGVFHGFRSYLLQDEQGQIQETHSIAPGLDYPAAGPEHSYLKDIGRVSYSAVDDQQALRGFELLSRSEGILPALESAHAVARAAELAPTLGRDHVLILNLSGRGDKDLAAVSSAIAERSQP
jgi:tryptophan synthase beta chain